VLVRALMNFREWLEGDVFDLPRDQAVELVPAQIVEPYDPDDDDDLLTLPEPIVAAAPSKEDLLAENQALIAEIEERRLNPPPRPPVSPLPADIPPVDGWGQQRAPAGVEDPAFTDHVRGSMDELAGSAKRMTAEQQAAALRRTLGLKPGERR
jgi:hypothetical protein